MLDPFAIIQAKPGETLPAKTMVRFAQGDPVIVTGDMAGDVNVYRLHGYEDCDSKVGWDECFEVNLGVD